MLVRSDVSMATPLKNIDEFHELSSSVAIATSNAFDHDRSRVIASAGPASGSVSTFIQSGGPPVNLRQLLTGFATTKTTRLRLGMCREAFSPAPPPNLLHGIDNDECVSDSPNSKDMPECLRNAIDYIKGRLSDVSDVSSPVLESHPLQYLPQQPIEPPPIIPSSFSSIPTVNTRMTTIKLKVERAAEHAADQILTSASPMISRAPERPIKRIPSKPLPLVLSSRLDFDAVPSLNECIRRQLKQDAERRLVHDLSHSLSDCGVRRRYLNDINDGEATKNLTSSNDDEQMDVVWNDDDLDIMAMNNPKKGFLDKSMKSVSLDSLDQNESQSSLRSRTSLLFKRKSGTNLKPNSSQ